MFRTILLQEAQAEASSLGSRRFEEYGLHVTSEQLKDHLIFVEPK